MDRMKNRISLFYANAREAAEKSGRTLYDVLCDAKAAGITALDYDHDDIKNGVPEAAAKAGLDVNSIYAFLEDCGEETERQARELIEKAAAYGAVVMFVTPFYEQPPESASADDAFLRDIAALLERLSVYGTKKGVPVCVENFDSPLSPTERKAGLVRLFSLAPHLRFNPDTGNSVTCGEDIRELCALFRERVVNVHCKDRIYGDGRRETCAVGSGCMPIAEIKKDLTESGYRGGFSIEVFGAEDVYEAIIASAGALITDD